LIESITDAGQSLGPLRSASKRPQTVKHWRGRAAKGEQAWPPLALFKAMLLAMWHDLSDVKLAEALDNKATIRNYCGFSTSEGSHRSRAGQSAVRRDHRKTKAIRVKTGTLVDATIIAPASQEDREARWVKHKGPAAMGKAGPDALPDEPDEVFADSAYRGQIFREAVRDKGGSLRVALTGMWGRDEAETLARLEAWN
jgi:IS5 family transposase